MEQWIIPCNISLYDVISAFEKLERIDWKQSNHSISVGDEVFIYVGKPISSILYRCKVIKANFANPKNDDYEFVLNGETFQNYGNYMELQLMQKFDDSQYHFDILVANGLKGRIQGPRRVKELGILLNTNNNFWIKEIDDTISKTVLKGKEKEVLIKARVNQSIYRDMLLNKHKKCCLCGISNQKTLIASHIKPWSHSESNEKLDVYNGLLLCPNHDKVFDSGLITFNNQGNIIISNELNSNDRILLNIRDDMKITLSENSIKYMEYHRTHIFQK